MYMYMYMLLEQLAYCIMMDDSFYLKEWLRVQASCTWIPELPFSSHVTLDKVFNHFLP